jgi:hypothetical protein
MLDHNISGTGTCFLSFCVNLEPWDRPSPRALSRRLELPANPTGINRAFHASVVRSLTMTYVLYSWDSDLLWDLQACFPLFGMASEPIVLFQTHLFIRLLLSAVLRILSYLLD